MIIIIPLLRKGIQDSRLLDIEKVFETKPFDFSIYFHLRPRESK